MAVIGNYSAALELIPDRAGRAGDFSSDSVVGAVIVVQLLDRDPVLERTMPSLFVYVHDRIRVIHFNLYDFWVRTLLNLILQSTKKKVGI